MEEPEGQLFRDHAGQRSLRYATKSRGEPSGQARDGALTALMSLQPSLRGEQSLVMDHLLSFAFPGLDPEVLMVAAKDLVAISNGSACTSSSYAPSHVLKVMGMSDAEANGCVRISWCHLTPEVDWEAVAARIRDLM